jgi:hypothetical protein
MAHDIRLQNYINSIGLTKKQIKAKQHYIGGSNAKFIWSGEWQTAYTNITGKGEDLSKIFHVNLGNVTEQYNVLWQASRKKWDAISFPDEAIAIDRKRPFIGALVDALGNDKNGVFVIDAKHTGAFGEYLNEDILIERYYWQAINNMVATGIPRFCLSVIAGNKIKQPIWIEYNKEHADEYKKRCESFWWHIENNAPPEEKELEDISDSEKSQWVEQDMSTSNEWISHSIDFVDNEEAHKKFMEAKKSIHSLVDKQTNIAWGGNVVAKRNSAGSLTISSIKKEKGKEA